MTGSVAQDQLRAFIERLERMHEERKAIASDIGEIYSEAKGNGFDVPTIKKVLKIRQMDHAERMEADAILDLYLSALGMLAEEPRAPAPARVEIIEQFDPETGEIQESVGARHIHASEVVTPSSDESVTPIQGYSDEDVTPQAVEKMRQRAAAAVDAANLELVSPGSAATKITEGLQEALAVAKGDAEPYRIISKPRRPYCQRPEMCGGQGAQHCYACEKSRGGNAA